MTAREQRLRKALELLLAWARGQKVDFAEVEKAVEEALK